MQPEAVLSALLELAQGLGIVVRAMPPSMSDGQHSGGALVRLRGQEILFLDDSSPVVEQVSALATALRGRAELEDRFLPPEIRQTLDNGA
jgi:hypothetical protein